LNEKAKINQHDITSKDRPIEGIQVTREGLAEAKFRYQFYT
jgi:hypothetical protein